MFPFPPNHRKKRKPQKFRPKSIQKNILELFQGPKLVSNKKMFDIKSRFSKRPRPSPVNHQSEYKKKELIFQLGETTVKPSTELEDFLGKPESVTVVTVSEDPPT